MLGLRRFSLPLHYGAKLAIAAAIAMTACVLASREADAQSRAETVRIVWPFETSSLDPAGAGVQRSTWGISWHIYDRLVSYELAPPKDRIQLFQADKPTGALAKNWEVSEDGRIYTFHLRPEAVFQNGAPVTADDVRWSLTRAISLPTTRFVLNVGGLIEESQLTTVDDRTLRIELSEPNRYLPLALSTPFAPIMNAEQVKERVTADDPWATEWLQNNAAGSGAYRVTNFRPDQVALERNDNWYGPKPQMRWAVFQTVPEETTRVAMVERAAADVAIGLTPNVIEGVERRDQARLMLIPMDNQFEFLVFNVQSKPFDDVRVRQAVAHAIPQKEIFESVFRGRGVPLFDGPGEIAEPVFPQPQSFGYDPEKSRKLLAEAGYPEGLETTLTFCTCKSEYFENLAVALKDYLSRVGIEATIEKYPGARFGELQTAKRMPLYLENQIAWLNLPDYWIRIFYRGDTRSNFSGYANPDLDPLIDQADKAKTPEDYDAAVARMIEIVNTKIPLLFFRQAALEVVARKDISNYAYWFHTLPDARLMARD